MAEEDISGCIHTFTHRRFKQMSLVPIEEIFFSLVFGLFRWNGAHCITTISVLRFLNMVVLVNCTAADAIF